MGIRRQRKASTRFVLFAVVRRYVLVSDPTFSIVLVFPRAVQWSAWLTHTRPDPPTTEASVTPPNVIKFILNHFLNHFYVNFFSLTQELQSDLIRQQKVKMNAAILEAKDQEERAQRERLVAPSHHSETEGLSPSSSQNVPTNQTLGRPESDQRPESQTRDPWAEALKGSDEPRSWTPLARRR